MRIKAARISKTVAAALVLGLPLSLFLYFVWRADAAMSKAGLGDLASWEGYQANAAFAFWSAVSMWLLVLLAAALKPSFRPIFVPAATVVPVLGGLVWLSLFFA